MEQPAAARDSREKSAAWLFLIFLAVPASSWVVCGYAENARLAWLASIFFFLFFIYCAGHATVGSPLGLLIDNRNVLSLSRTQIACWTILLFPAIITAALWNNSVGNVEPLQFQIPSELWILMGISTASFVASPLVLDNKKKERISLKELDKTKKDLIGRDAAADAGDVGHNGALVVNRRPDQARFLDLITGEETGNAARMDLSRVQMLFLTVSVLAAYAAALWRMFGALDGQSVEAFPSLDDSLLAMIGISHAGYIAFKAAPHSSKAANDDDDGGSNNDGGSSLNRDGSAISVASTQERDRESLEREEREKSRGKEQLDARMKRLKESQPAPTQLERREQRKDDPGKPQAEDGAQ